MRPTLVILAGGKGTRLGKLTKNTPKPMVNVCGKPFLYWLIRNYRKQGFRRIIISTGYKEKVIQQYPWPPSWNLHFESDSSNGGPAAFYNDWNYIIVNGDTWILDQIPTSPKPWILHVNGVDAGAQYPGPGKICTLSCSGFIDIGTWAGLLTMRGYFKTHLVNKFKVCEDKLRKKAV